MALSASTVFEIRSTGSDDNGGGFVTGASGTDFSQQDAAQYSDTDGTATNANVTFTDANANFGTDVIGNLLNVITGTNATPGRYEILARPSTTTLTLDRTCASSVSATDIQYRIGGAVATPGAICGGFVAGNIAHWKTGSYTASSTSNVSGGRLTLSVAATLIGYVTTREDVLSPGTGPTFTCGANSVTAITGSATGWKVVGVIIDGDKATRTGTVGVAGSSSGVLMNSVVQNCAGNGFSNTAAQVTRCIIKSNGGVGAGAGSIHDSCIRDNTGNGASVVSARGSMTNCLVHSNGGAGVQLGDACLLSHSTIALNGTSGVVSNTLFGAVTGCILYGNTGYGIDANNVTGLRVIAQNNAFGGNTTAATRGANLLNYGAITLSGNPFTDSANDDYDIAPASAGGLEVKSAGVGFTDGLNTVLGTFDLGCHQIAPASSSVIVIDD